jgi:type VI secretion system protein ImpH
VLRHVEALRPDLPRIGAALRPSQEVLRLGQDRGDFAPSALESFSVGADPGRARRALLRAARPQGPMPLHFTEYVRERLRFRGDATLARFLDVFHHRLLALFTGRGPAQPTVHHDRPGSDRFGAWLGASFKAEGAACPRPAREGEALPGGAARQPQPPRRRLGRLLRQYFNVPVHRGTPQWLA